MATIPFEDVFESRPFKFYIGPNKKLYHAHTAAIKKLSKPLSALIDGFMSEAQSGSSILEDTEEHTFVRFCQFAYTGDYDAAEPDIVLDSSAIDATDVANRVGEAEPAATTPLTPPVEPEPPTEPEVEPEPEQQSLFEPWIPASTKVYESCQNCGWTPPAFKGKRKKNRPRIVGKPEVSLWETFVSTEYGHSVGRFEARKNREPYEEYKKVFLGHAQLYVFADKYLIASLRELSLYKLHRTLIDFTLYHERIGDIVELIRYIYAIARDDANDADDAGSSDGEDPLKPLKQMVICYVACVIEQLAMDSEFQRLLKKFSEFSQDIVLKMLKRLAEA